MQSHGAVPSDDDVRHLLPASRSTNDARVAAAVTLILAFGFTLAELNRLRWSHFDPKTGRLLRSGKNGAVHEQLTELLVRQILAIQPLGTKLFQPTTALPLRLATVLAQTFELAGLSRYTIADFVRWSHRQPLSVRGSVATA